MAIKVEREMYLGMGKAVQLLSQDGLFIGCEVVEEGHPGEPRQRCLDTRQCRKLQQFFAEMGPGR